MFSHSKTEYNCNRSGNDTIAHLKSQVDQQAVRLADTVSGVQTSWTPRKTLHLAAYL